MNHLPLIIKREYLTKVKNKSFIMMTFLSPLIFIVLIAFVAYLSQLNNDKIRVVSILDESGLVKDVFKNSGNTSYNILEGMSVEDAKMLVLETKGYGLLHIDDITEGKLTSKDLTFYSEESPSLTLISNLESEIQSELTLQNRIREGIDIEKLKASRVNIEINQESFEGEKTSKVDSIVKLIFGGAAGYQETISRPAFITQDKVKEKEVYLNGEVNTLERNRVALKKTTICLKGLMVEHALGREAIKNYYNLTANNN